ncbi:hypothetical protein JCM3775_001744 [Rhodotorula graminis]|uniref:Peptidase S8/S53 domain-containing protein n=1 Tax=Rhodotorula graminis (strain WP1) TaxID=578459 RepID=A0A194S2R5_RHOGW|nr:uncharacterized protein RHOBADRAFT_53928 [Rhodotorula graminis WP1]KPV75023.1 hypothetical protein RHOBADRAFT_53928 [Rhodotorula graminis WP1]
MALLAVALVALFSVSAAFQQHDAATSRYVRNSYFVEVDASSSSLSKRGLTPFAALSRTLAAVERKGIKYTVRQRFESLPDVFHGASIQVPDGVSLDELSKIDGVKRVWPVQKIYLPREPAVDDYVSTSSMASQRLAKRTSSSFEKRATTFPPASAYAGDTFYPHVETGIDGLHNSGILGAGVKIAVLDSGVDYTNPILGGCFGPGCHISFGYDFCGDNYNGDNTPVPDDDPFTTCTSHGTHVTGIIGALANQYGVSGVAPQATLGHYRITGCNEIASDDIMVAAMMRALHDGVDVINVSLGSVVSWTNNSPTQIMAEYLASQGVAVVASAGNDRTEGLFFAEGPAAGLATTAVGATDPIYWVAYNATLRNRGTVPYMSPMPFNITRTSLLYFTSTDPNVASDACTALPSSTPSLVNRVVVVRRGGCDFAVKLNNLAKAGAKIVLIYNSPNTLTLPQFNVGTTGLEAVGGLRYEDGVRLLDLFKSTPRGQPITFPFGPLVSGVVDGVTGGTASYYSSYGPTNDLNLYPSITAPGTNILSTVVGGLGIMRGTSQSSPLVAGAYALILSQRKNENLSPQQLKSLFMTTSAPIPNTYGSSTLDSVISQGAGRIDVGAALAAKTLITPAVLELNDTGFPSRTQRLTLSNRNSDAVTYTFSSTIAQGMATYDNGVQSDVIPSTSPDDIDTPLFRISYSDNSVTVPAGGSASVTVVFTALRYSNQQTAEFPIYSGFIDVRGTSASAQVQAFTVPFFGLASRMIDMPVLDTTGAALGPNLPFLAVGQDIATAPITVSRSNAPTVFFRLAAGTRRLRVDLVAGDIDFQGTIPSVTNPTSRLAKRSKNDLRPRATPALFNDVPTVGSIFAPDYYPPRDYLVNGPYPYSDYEYTLDGKYTNKDGTPGTASAGVSYRVLIRALKITADPSLSSSYESWLSTPFQYSS